MLKSMPPFPRLIFSALRWALLASLASALPGAGQTTTSGLPQPGVQTGVQAILPNGRLIRPVGNWLTLAPFPFAIALKPDGSEAVIPSIGFPFALNVITHPAASSATVHRLPSGEDNDPKIETHAGLAYSPDGATLYVATGNSGKITLYSTSDWHAIGQIPLDGKVEGGEFAQSFAASVLVSRDGLTLYALDQGNWRVAVIDAASGSVVASLPTGAYPFGIALSADGGRLYITNTGIFEYTTIPGAEKEDSLGSGLKFPPFGYPSKDAEEGVTGDDGRKIPGLGDANSDRGSSLWTYDLRDGKALGAATRLRLGLTIREERDGPAASRVGGSAPTGVVAGAGAVYVSLAHQDSVVKISADGKQILAETSLSPFPADKFHDSHNRPLRGVMPSGLALDTHANARRLYVAESGIDAVAVLDADTMHIIEHIPAGWTPSAVALSPDNKTLYIVNTKGKGAGPNGGKPHDSHAPSYVGALEYGSLSVVDLATLPDAAGLTHSVLAANTYALADKPALPKLKHCFLVIRENRTYDEVLGDVPRANGDPSLARYGIDGWAEERGKPGRAASHLKVTPNLHSLAALYAISDNFYVDSDVSADGHRWVVGINPTAFFNTAWTSGYGGRRDSFPGASQPGRRALFGGADAPMPEDEPQFGSIWEHVADSGRGILNYGEGLEVEGNDEMDGAEPEGQRLFLNSPVPRPIFESSDRRFPTFNLGIPDQFRVEEFKRDFSRRLAQDKIPGLIVIRLPGDHTAEARPADGYPYRASYVADNDLALGRIIDYLSTTPIWKDSALFVTEDDAQDGIDHVDAHRSILLAASPWVKPGWVSHQHSSMGSITRTMCELLGIGPLNLEDALSGQLTDMFASAPAMGRFRAVSSDLRVFDPAKARIARPKTKQEAAGLRDMDDSSQIETHLGQSSRSLEKAGPDPRKRYKFGKTPSSHDTD